MGLFTDGYRAFNTPEREFSDGEESCAASLQATRKDDGKTLAFVGSTKSQRGHAEIDALYQFLKSIQWLPEKFIEFDITVTCLAKPCCKYCASIMGLLGIKPSDETYKVNKSMGVSYALPPDVRRFLRKFLDVTEEKIIEQLCG